MANFYIGINFNSESTRGTNHTTIKMADNVTRDIKISTVNIEPLDKEELIGALTSQFEAKVRQMM